jgi:hypothetical protein
MKAMQDAPLTGVARLAVSAVVSTPSWARWPEPAGELRRRGLDVECRTRGRLAGELNGMRADPLSRSAPRRAPTFNAGTYYPPNTQSGTNRTGGYNYPGDDSGFGNAAYYLRMTTSTWPVRGHFRSCTLFVANCKQGCSPGQVIRKLVCAASRSRLRRSPRTPGVAMPSRFTMAFRPRLGGTASVE